MSVLFFRQCFQIMMTMDRATASKEVSIERRGTSRFPLREDVSYKLAKGKAVMVGSGKTVNIGSHGVLFTTEHPLPVGHTVEVSINWPALLDGTCRLKFVASGEVVRSQEDCAAVRIKTYEFRTRASRPN
jgi:hypothetical protein